jgi:DHA3 family macrolide efflux protein-like MFS transporter
MQFYLNMLRQPHLARLWASQVLSAVGDQLHFIAILWISIQVGGANAGFVVAAGTTAGLVCGLIAGVYADRWNRQVSMVVVDLLRGVAVLMLALAAQLGPLQLWQMAIVSAIVSALGSLFSPCLYASLPALTDDALVLRAMNALMNMTYRIARLIGPAIAGLILAAMPIRTFFVVDAVTYVVSAWAIWSLGKNYAWKPEARLVTPGIAGILDDLKSSANIGLRERQVGMTFLQGTLCPLFWSAAYIIGIPLALKQSAMMPAGAGITAYATIICVYGLGNVVSNLIVGTMDLHRRPGFFFSLGVFLMGTGFFIVGSAPNFYVALAGAALAATGGPLGDMAIISMTQQFPDNQRGKLGSMLGFLGGIGMTLGLMLAPPIYSTTGGAMGIVYAAVGLIVTGLFGLVLTKRNEFQVPAEPPAEEKAAEPEPVPVTLQ